MREKLGASGPSPALEPAVQPPKNRKRPPDGGEPKEKIENACQNQSDRHEIARIGLVPQDPADEFAGPVGKAEDAA